MVDAVPGRGADLRAADDADWAARVGRVSLEPLEVLTCRPLGDLRHVTCAAPSLAPLVRPGHLVSLAPRDAATLVRRGVPVAGVSAGGAYGATVELVLAADDAGPLGPGDRLEAIGPLGRPTPLPTAPVPAVVVGVGRGSGLAVWLAEALGARGCDVDLVLGAPTSSVLGDVAAARRSARSVTLVTSDGTSGVRGQVGDAAGDVVEQVGAQVVYAVGPVRDLLAVSDAATLLGAVAQCVVDDPLPCVTGACGACAVPVVDRDGTTVLARVCIEGPTLRGDRVRWDAVGPAGRRIPGDTVIGRRPR